MLRNAWRAQKNYMSSFVGKNVLSMRVIITVGMVILITSAVIVSGWVAERNVQSVMTRELETRLLLEARNLALLSASAFLSEFPELTLHPILKDMKAKRSDLAILYVVDHKNVILGHPDVLKLRDLYEPDTTLVAVSSDLLLNSDEMLLGNERLLVVQTPIKLANGKQIGTAIVGLGRDHIGMLIMKARKDLGLFLLVILTIAILITPVLISFLLRPLRVLRNGLERIGSGDLDARVELSSMTELGVLSRSVNDMAAKLKSAQKDLVEKERLDREMELAKEIQLLLLPKGIGEIDGFIIRGAQESAEIVGGDYYDFFPLGEGKTGVVIADVAGKGLGGCLVTSMIAVLIRTLSSVHESPSKLLTAVHESLTGFLQPGVFITMFYGVLDSNTARLTYASAGHNPVLHYIARLKEITWYKTTGVPLGLIPTRVLQTSLKDYTLEIEQGDLIVQYTDGFHEAVNEKEEEFGFDRMSDLVHSLVAKGSESVISGLQRSVHEWEKPRSASDDQTLLLIERPPAARIRNDRPKKSQSASTGGINNVSILWEKKRDEYRFEIPATFEALDRIGDWLKQCPTIKQLPQENSALLEQGLYELGANIAEHGYNLDPTKRIEFWWVPESYDPLGSRGTDSYNSAGISEQIHKGYFLIRDFGRKPEHEQWLLPDSNDDTVRRNGRGLGLRIIHAIFTDLEFYSSPDLGNITTMRFINLQPQPS